MKVVKKNVYCCDFCKKRSLKSLVKHEKHCTANPNRECRLCENKISIPELIKTYSVSQAESGNMPLNYIAYETFEQIRDDADQCPACILAILRALNAFVITADIEIKDECLDTAYYDGFEQSTKLKFQYHYNFKKALAIHWQCKNDADREAEERATYY